MHDSIRYGPIQGQGQGHGASELQKIALFKVFLLRHLHMENNYVPCKNLIMIRVKIAT